jgi:hypothetical protein
MIETKTKNKSTPYQDASATKDTMHNVEDVLVVEVQFSASTGQETSIH